MKATRSSITSLSFVVLFIALIAVGPALQAGAQSGTPAAATPTPPALPPAQPATGPGGADFSFDGLRAQHYGPDPASGAAATGYWLFEPTGPHPGVAAGPLPLVLFFHGFDVLSPEFYHAWIDHLVRRGAILISPDYQAPNLGYDDPTGLAVENAASGYIQTAVRAALAELAHGSHAQPDVRRVEAIGHSQGAVLAADYAGRASAAGLPVPEALLIAMPGCAPGCDLTKLAQIPAATRVIVLVADHDVIVGETWARPIWAQLSQIPAAHKAYIRVRTDEHGHPALLADHPLALTTTYLFFGETVGVLDAYDWYGTWKWADALMSCGFAGTDCPYALGDTPEQRFMGLWSDGVPVKEAQIVQDPGTPTP